MKHFLVLACLLNPVALAFAGAVDDLKHFLATTQTLKADFSQMVIGKSGRQGKKNTGVVHLSRPGKLRWELGQPYAYLLVSDGERVWGFDPDLKQVTIRRASQILGSTPASLLAGKGGDLERDFVLREAADADGMQWVEATPKNTENGFGRLRLGLAGGELRAMELADQLGQTTYIRFANLERNQPLAPGLFRFTPPSGSDVINE